MIIIVSKYAIIIITIIIIIGRRRRKKQKIQTFSGSGKDWEKFSHHGLKNLFNIPKKVSKSCACVCVCVCESVHLCSCQMAKRRHYNGSGLLQKSAEFQKDSQGGVVVGGACKKGNYLCMDSCNMDKLSKKKQKNTTQLCTFIDLSLPRPHTLAPPSSITHQPFVMDNRL